MRVAEAWRSALDGVVAHPLRSGLTALGLAIGVGATMLIVGCLRGFDCWVADKLARIGPDVFVLTERAPERVGEQPPVRLRRDDAVAIAARLDSVVEAVIEAETSTIVVVDGQQIGPVEVRGTEAHDPVELGRGLTEGEQLLGASVCVLGRDVADQLFAGVDPLGRQLRVGARRYEVVGVAPRLGSAFGYSLDGFVSVPLRAFRLQFGAEPLARIKARAVRGADLEALAAAAREIVALERGRDVRGPDGLEVQTVAAARAAFDGITSRLVPVAFFLVGVALFVGALVVMNIMLVSVVQRTREIGIRKAVGAADRDIALQFLLEAFVLSAGGGVAGIALGALACGVANGMTPFAVATPTDAPWLAVGICTAVAIAAGVHPALRAARLPVVTALGSGRT